LRLPDLALAKLPLHKPLTSDARVPEPSLSRSAYLRLVGLGAVIGIPAAFLAALFLAVVHDVEHWLWDSLPSSLGHSAPPWRRTTARTSTT
jgi:hypothetical protein